MAKPQKRKYSIKFLQLSTPRQTWRYLQTSVPESGQSWKLNWKKWRIITTKVVIATKNGSTTQTWLIALEWMLLLSQPSLWNPQQFQMLRGMKVIALLTGMMRTQLEHPKRRSPRKGQPGRGQADHLHQRCSHSSRNTKRKKKKWKTKKLR